MNSRKQFFILICLWPLALPAAAANMPEAISPGSFHQPTAVEWRCPGFSWRLVEGARYQLTITRIDATTLGPVDEEPLVHRLPEGVTRWTPAGADCLQRGASYEWFVTALDLNGWAENSDVLRFHIPAGPSAAEINQAIDILRAAGLMGVSGDGTELTNRTGRSSPMAIEGPTPSFAVIGETESGVDGSAGVSGHASNPSGDTHGVLGTTDSPDGSAVTAANLNAGGGADLELDGTAQGKGDTAMTESTLLVGGPSFELTNAGSDLSVLINGVSAVTSVTDADTLANLSCSADDVAIWNGTAWECRCLNQQPCYSGPPETLGVGICAAGTTNCALGSGSTCEGESLPQSETGFCNGIDDDCSGIVDDGGCGECILFGLGAHICNDESEACYLSPGSGLLICAPEGSAMPGEACTFVNDCQQGSGCVAVDGENLVCATYCEFPDNDPDLCDPGEICEQLDEEVGICVTP